MNDLLLQKQFKHLVNQSKSGILGQLILTFLVTLLLSQEALFPQTYLWIWLGFALLTQALRLRAYLQFQTRNQKMPIENVRPWKNQYIRHVLFNGILWAVLFASVFYYTPIEYHYIMMAIGLGLSGAAVVTLGAIYKVYAFFTGPMLLTLMLLMFFSPSQQEFISSMVLALGLSYLLITGKKYADNLANLFQQQIELKAAQSETLVLLGRAGEFKDSETGDHVKRVATWACQLAKREGLSDEEAKMLGQAGTLHDLGKVAIPDRILLKPGKLDPDEWQVMQTHVTEGAKILASSKSPMLQLAKVIAESHHEKWDGSGYPNGLKGTEIPLPGRILAICDVYDALTSERPYKQAWSKNQALDYLQDQSGQHFDPKLVQDFIDLHKELQETMVVDNQVAA